MATIRREIGDLLVDNGVISQQDLDLVREEHWKTGDSIIDILSKKGLANEHALKNALELEYGVNFVDLNKSKNQPEDDAVRTLPETLMREYRILGIQKQQDKLTLAMADPSDSTALAEAQRILPGIAIKTVVCVEDDLVAFLNKTFGLPRPNSGMATIELDQTPFDTDGGEVDLTATPGSKSKSPTFTRLEAQIVPERTEVKESEQEEAVILLANQVLGGAIKRRSTQVHIIPSEKDSVIAYRINGQLVQDRKLPRTIASAVVARYKMMAKLDPSERNLCQDGHIKVKSSSKEIVCLVSIIPTVVGEHTVIWIV